MIDRFKSVMLAKIKFSNKDDRGNQDLIIENA